MRQLGLVAIGALGKDGPGQAVMGAARRGAALGLSSFGIGHLFLFAHNRLTPVRLFLNRAQRLSPVRFLLVAHNGLTPVRLFLFALCLQTLERDGSSIQGLTIFCFAVFLLSLPLLLTPSDKMQKALLKLRSYFQTAYQQ